MLISVACMLEEEWCQEPLHRQCHCRWGSKLPDFSARTVMKHATQSRHAENQRKAVWNMECHVDANMQEHHDRSAVAIKAVSLQVLNSSWCRFTRCSFDILYFSVASAWLVCPNSHTWDSVPWEEKRKEGGPWAEKWQCQMVIELAVVSQKSLLSDLKYLQNVSDECQKKPNSGPAWFQYNQLVFKTEEIQKTTGGLSWTRREGLAEVAGDLRGGSDLVA